MKTEKQIHRELHRDVDKFIAKMKKKYIGAEVLSKYNGQNVITTVESITIDHAYYLEIIKNIDLDLRNPNVGLFSLEWSVNQRVQQKG